MFLFSRPGAESIRAFLSAQRSEPFSYVHVGASRVRAPTGYVVDHNRIQLGHGVKVFERAIGAIRQWRMFDMTWLDLYWPDAPIEAGANVAILVSHFGFWSLNACRIVYVVEEHGTSERYGFAYGTLPEHAEEGEERFTVEFHTDDETVWYDLYAFSRPKPLARLAYPLTRALQRRFTRDSKQAMQTAVERPRFHSRRA